jgi:hypothetical protein
MYRSATAGGLRVRSPWRSRCPWVQGRTCKLGPACTACPCTACCTRGCRRRTCRCGSCRRARPSCSALVLPCCTCAHHCTRPCTCAGPWAVWHAVRVGRAGQKAGKDNMIGWMKCGARLLDDGAPAVRQCLLMPTAYSNFCVHMAQGGGCKGSGQRCC